MISVADMLLRLGDGFADIDQILLQDLIEGAHAFVERQTRRTFREVAADTVYLTGNGSRRLWLPEPPVMVGSPAAYDVAVEESRYPGGTSTTLALATDFEVRMHGSEGWLARLGGSYWKNGYEYAVTYSHGYAADAYPEDVVDVVAGLVALRVQLAGMEATRSESVGGYSYTRFGEGDLDAIPGALDTIEAWRPPVFA